ncbi:hypothetical protein [Dyadobacter sediminis]|uniref:Uncharacterized protein n=1 Tax=Dyadobacter sediminis TaxID=1493691 RepID=A0A5R9KB48_9BACT|nr:hypothetical protein [Dyadobacter sediminis]TLU91988.1 hypothetical protein FEM55_14600 [Dyadobacter sediminis]GGB98450.1 hypothetical protein GCM10011325_27170 [Dyadobacter sediminis]
MNADNAIQWIQAERFNQWRLNRGEDEKVSEYDSDNESEEEAVERLTNILRLQQPGKYVLKAYKGKGRQAAQSTYRFEITRPALSQPGSASHQNFDYQEIFEKAKALARAEFEEQAFKKEVLQRLDSLELEVEKIRKSILELNDEDEENDEDALERLSSVAQKLPGLAKGFDSMKGLFKPA